jgi:2-methylcitrate dehydratase PrpD
VAVKPYPACHLLHGATEAAIALHRQGIDTRTVRRVLARVPADAVAVVCEPLASKRRPRTDYEAKFSLPYAVASGLLRGRLGLADLEPGALIAADARQLMDRIEYEVDASTTYPRHYPGEVVVELEDGRRHSARIAVNLGHEERPLTRPDVEEKFFANAGRHASAARARALRDAIALTEKDRPLASPEVAPDAAQAREALIEAPTEMFDVAVHRLPPAQAAQPHRAPHSRNAPPLRAPRHRREPAPRAPRRVLPRC